SAWGGDCAANGTITLLPGDTKTCTITNDDIAPTLTVVKTVINDDGGQANPNDFQLTVGGNPVSSGVATTLTANTPYAINETSLPNYVFVSIGGHASCPSVLGGTISLPVGADITCTITNNDVAPTLSIGDVSLPEGNSGSTAATFTVILSHASTQAVTVNFATADGTATLADSDYQSASGTVTFAPGQTSQTVTVLINGDTTFEADEIYSVNLSGAINATISDGVGIGAIQNDDAQPTITINDVSTLEGNAGTTNAVFTVSLSNASAQPVTVNFATADGTATLADSDYQSASGTVTFAPGQTSQTVTVLINGDTTFEVDETYSVNLSGATNATISDGVGIGTIRNDDAQPTFAIDDVTLLEGNTGTTSFTFTVTKTGATDLPATVNFGTADGTAIAPGDYIAATGTLTFAPDVTTQTVTVNVNGDTLQEADETFEVTLNGALNATITDGQAIGTITNDDNNAVKGKVTGGGQVMPSQGGTASFGYVAQRKTDGGPASGHFNYVNHTTGLHISGPVNDLAILSETSATFSGTWGACTFEVYLEDNGEPGVASGDQLEVSYSCESGDVNDAPLQILLHGNNQIHRPGTNSPPVANADSVTTPETFGTTINVRANDIAGPADDAGQTFTVTAVGWPSNGSVLINGDQTITYTPAGSFDGTDTFSYTICDNGTTGGEPDPLCATGFVTVTVTPGNDPPIAGAITWSSSVDPLKINTSVTASVNFTDSNAGDSHTATWNWGDGTTSTGTVNAAAGTVIGTKSYATAGMYTVTVTITDAAGAKTTSIFKTVNVYNPLSTITASGSFNSPAGSFPASPAVVGTATFSSVSVKYLNGATTPSGTTSFTFNAAKLTFTASSFKWLVTKSGKAWYRGAGTVSINGVSQAANVLVAAVDGPNLTSDYFRIKIWTAFGVVYDNQMGAADDVTATILAITGPGSVTVK
ncbi:MAG TPA: Calx-beta domain-containing protein, partial [Vicinamibacterales bacterium]|nr:Calx-beta domain-containing protein [Vicinamibacterales bacterium]